MWCEAQRFTTIRSTLDGLSSFRVQDHRGSAWSFSDSSIPQSFAARDVKIPSLIALSTKSPQKMVDFCTTSSLGQNPDFSTLKQPYSDSADSHDGIPNDIVSTSVPTENKSSLQQQDGTNLTALQQHVLFWDRDNDGIIHPLDVYTGFRELGFNVLFSFGSLLIPIFFSYPTTIAYSWLPDPWLRIYVGSIHKAKHGSDTGIFDVDGHFHADRFDAVFERWDLDRCGGLSADQMWHMWKKNRLAADVAGWCFAFMEIWTTWLPLERDGRVWKEDLRDCYDGTLFWRISEKVQKREWRQGYGVGDFFDGMLRSRTWRNWEVKKGKNEQRLVAT